MFGSFLRNISDKRANVAFNVLVNDIHMQKNEYFLPNSTYSLYQEKDLEHKLRSSKNLVSVLDTRHIAVNDALKFYATLFELKSQPGTYQGKKRRINIRQHSLIGEQECYRDVGHFDLDLASIVLGPKITDHKYEISDPEGMLSGSVHVTIRYKFKNADGGDVVDTAESSRATSNASSFYQSLSPTVSPPGKQRSFNLSRQDTAYLEEWGEDAYVDEEEKEDDRSWRPKININSNNRAHSGVYELSLNRVNSTPNAAQARLARETSQNSEASDRVSPTEQQLQAVEPPKQPKLLRKITSEDVNSVAFTSQGEMILASEAVYTSPVGNRYGMQQQQASMSSELSETNLDYHQSHSHATNYVVEERSQIVIPRSGSMSSFHSQSVKSVRFEDSPSQYKSQQQQQLSHNTSGGSWAEIRREQSHDYNEEEEWGVVFEDMLEFGDAEVY